MELLLLNKTDISADTTLVLHGSNWTVTGPYTTTEAKSLPRFACVSYVWGLERVPHPYINGVDISSNTIKSLESAIKTCDDGIDAYWIDVFCVPWEQPARSATLESMGLIYSLADQVIAVLGSDCTPALKEMSRQDWIDGDFLSSLERDEWICSVWTYQEIVNSRRMQVTTSTGDGDALSGDTFLNRIGMSLHQYKKARGLNSFLMRQRFPRLDALEDIGGDYMIWAPFERPALQIMSMLDRRTAVKPQNKYYSLIGALTNASTERPAGETISNLRTKAMDICEGKGDFSFVYTSTPRDQTAADRAWAPSAEYDLTSILPWFTHGERQDGYRDAQGQVWLRNVTVMQTITTPPQDLVDKLCSTLTTLPFPSQMHDDQADFESISSFIGETLRSIGFTGVRQPLVTLPGIFYPQFTVSRNAELQLVISTELSWTFGHPGLCIVNQQYIPGVFVGKLKGISPVQYQLSPGT